MMPKGRLAVPFFPVIVKVGSTGLRHSWFTFNSSLTSERLLGTQMISFVMCCCCSAFRLLPTAVLLVFSLILRCLAVGSWYKPWRSIQWMVHTRPCLVLRYYKVYVRTYRLIRLVNLNLDGCDNPFLPFWAQSTQQQKKEKNDHFSNLSFYPRDI